MKKGFVFIMFAVLFVLVCSFFASAAFEDELLDLINKERNRLGGGNLTINAQLTQSATLHSQDLLTNNYFSHYSLDGRNPTDRGEDSGFSGGVWENIAAHSGSPNASWVYNIWRNSPGHYANMINSNVNVAGIGVAEGQWDYDGFGIYPISTISTLNLGYVSQPSCQSGDNQTQNCGSNIGVCEYGTRTRNCNENGYWGVWSACGGGVLPSIETCNSLDDDCDGKTDENYVCEPLAMNLISPGEDSFFSSRYVPISVNLSRAAKLVYVLDNNIRISSCSNCQSFTRSFRFANGEHNVRVEAYDQDNNLLEDDVSFEVYVSNLRIISTIPRLRSIAGKNTQFVINYVSDLPIIGRVIISNESYSEILENNCPVSTSTTGCVFSPNIPDDIMVNANVTFEIENEYGIKAGKNYFLLIDTKKPELSINSSVYISSRYKRIRVLGNLSERASVEYLDSYGVYRRLCSGCSRFSRYFTTTLSGTIDLNLRVTDMAGNQQEFSFLGLG